MLVRSACIMVPLLSNIVVLNEPIKTDHLSLRFQSLEKTIPGENLEVGQLESFCNLSHAHHWPKTYTVIRSITHLARRRHQLLAGVLVPLWTDGLNFVTHAVSFRMALKGTGNIRMGSLATYQLASSTLHSMMY